MIDFSVYYAVQLPATPRDEPPALVIATHGYGQSCKSFMRELAPFRDENVIVVAPQGPSQFYWQQRPPKVGFTWVTRFMRDNTLDDIMAYMRKLFAEIRRQYEFDPAKVFFLGFSNGAALAFRVAASGIADPAGVIACCGDLPANVAEQLDRLPKFPALIVHGKKDTMMRLERGREAEATLREYGFSVDTIYFDGGHEVPEEQWVAIAEWTRARI